MFRRPVIAAALAVLAIPGTALAAPAKPPKVIKDVSIPPVPLAELQSSITNDRGIKLGGVGSGLFPAARRGDFWMVTDRGPNGQPTVNGQKVRTFPIPEFDPIALQVPDKKTGDASRISRILTFDIRSRKVTGEYAYQFEDVTTFDPKVNGDQSEMKISGLAYAGHGRLLVDERTDNVARIYVIDLNKATNLLGGKYDDPATTPSLEALADLSSIKLPDKSPLVDLSVVAPTLPGKVEGIALLDRRTLVVANDNDFGLGAFDANGKLIDTGVASRIVTIRLPKAL